MPEDLLTRFVLAMLATWRVTHLLAAEDGPDEVIFRLRRALGTSWLGSLVDCFNCLSLFVAAPVAFFVVQSPISWAMSWLALSGGACLLERLGGAAPFVDPFASTLKGNEDVLQQSTSDASSASPAPHAHDGDPGGGGSR